MNVSTDNLQWRTPHTPIRFCMQPIPPTSLPPPIHSPKYVYTSHLERTTTHTKYIHLYPDNHNSRWVVNQWCPRSFCSLSRDDTRASRYHGVRMYSINADDYHLPSVLRRDRSHPILLLVSHGQVNSPERLNPKNLSKVLCPMHDIDKVMQNTGS